MAIKHAVCEDGFNVQIYKEVTFNLPWTYKNPDGTPIDLTGKSIVFKVILEDVTHTYTSTPNSYGSLTEVTDEPNGEFYVKITDEETATFDVEDGRWALLLIDGGDTYPIYNHNPDEGMVATVRISEL